MKKEMIQKSKWLFVELLEDGPRMLSDIVKTTGMERRLVEDCLYELMQEGKVICGPDSKLRLP